VFCAVVLLVLMGAIGVERFPDGRYAGTKIHNSWSSMNSRTNTSLLAPAHSHCAAAFYGALDFSDFAIFFALSLINWKYLCSVYTFSCVDIWKPWPIRRLENCPAAGNHGR